jgi:hypothetical protein
MTDWAKLTIAGLGLVGTGLGFSIWYGSYSWNKNTSQLVEKLTAITQRGAEKVSFKNFEQLPVPVANYFRRVLKEGQSIIRSARLIQQGEFRTSEATDRWSRFDAKEYFSTKPTGFVWDSSITMSPLMKIRIRDAYLEGRGSMKGKILSLVTVIDEHDKVELHAGALQRYLAEAVWLPTALLPDNGVKWSAIDSNRALATLSDSDTTVSLEFHFNDTGEITSVFTPGRYREVKGRYELTPWAGHFRHYEERGGMLIPVEGEVEWQMQGGNFTYWKGRIVDAEYKFAG